MYWAIQASLEPATAEKDVSGPISGDSGTSLDIMLKKDESRSGIDHTKTPSTADNLSVKINVSFESHKQNMADLGVSNFEEQVLPKKLSAD